VPSTRVKNVSRRSGNDRQKLNDTVKPLLTVVVMSKTGMGFLYQGGNDQEMISGHRRFCLKETFYAKKTGLIRIAAT
jgi:hypothetical protein